MTELLEKRELLRTAGYKYNFNREVYVNRDDKKVFSLEFVEDHPQWELPRRTHYRARTTCVRSHLGVSRVSSEARQRNASIARARAMSAFA